MCIAKKFPYWRSDLRLLHPPGSRDRVDFANNTATVHGGSITHSLLAFRRLTCVGTSVYPSHGPMASPVLGGILIADEVVDLLIPVLFYKVRRHRWSQYKHSQMKVLTL